MAVAWKPRWRPIISAAIVAAIVSSVVAKNVAQLSVPEIEDAIQVGIRSLSTQKRERPRAMSYRNWLDEGMPHCRRAEYPQARNEPRDFQLDLTDFRTVVPGVSCCQCSPRYSIYFWSTESVIPVRFDDCPFAKAGSIRLPSRVMPSKHRSFLPICHGRLRRWGSTRRYSLPPTAWDLSRRSSSGPCALCDGRAE